jgi:acid phosphatase class B
LIGYGENNIGFFVLEGKADLSPNEDISKLVYFDSHNNYLEEESEEADTHNKNLGWDSMNNRIDNNSALKEIEDYLKKKRLQ